MAEDSTQKLGELLAALHIAMPTIYMGHQALTGLRKCPHCSVASPNLVAVFWTGQPTPRSDAGVARYWGSYRCTSCGSLVSATATSYDSQGRYPVSEYFPSSRTAAEDIPPIARTFLQQAFDTLHAPDASAVMAGSAVDAMLKERGYKDGSLYSRIDKALKDNLLTKGMAEWAHSVRLGSNRPRHADEDRPHVSPDEAKQSVEFADALGQFLYVLTAKIDAGMVAARTVSD
jgi:hypothetical protein